MVVHTGKSTRHGHYNTYVRHDWGDDNSCVEYNDTRITIVTKTQLLQIAAGGEGNYNNTKNT